MLGLAVGHDAEVPHYETIGRIHCALGQPACFH